MNILGQHKLKGKCTFKFALFLLFLLCNIFLCVSSARERILTNLRKHNATQAALAVVPMRAPVPDVPTTCLSDEAASSALLHEALTKLQHQAR